MFDWDLDRSEITRSIQGKHTQLKIVLKTKNESLLLQKWIEHHIRIAGAIGLVIIDNESSDEAVLDVYEELAGIFVDITVFKYAGFHNNIHDVGIFSDLYKALRSSCDYYCFLDTDEFLYWVESDGTYVADETVVQKIVSSNEMVIPGIWIENHYGFEDVLQFTFGQNRIRSGLKSGKPIISRNAEVNDFINHNIQMPGALFENCRTANVVIAHLKYLSREQRLATNLEKLRNYNKETAELARFGLSGIAFGLEDVLQINVNILNRGNARTYVQEIIECCDQAHYVDRELNAGSVIFREGKMKFHDESERERVLSFLKGPKAIIETCLANR